MMRPILTCLGLSLLLLNAGAAQAQFSFTSPTAAQDVYGSWRGIATADFNGDGRADVVVSAWCGARCDNYLRVYLATASGTLQPAISLATSLNPLRVITTDVTGDNKPDIVLAHLGGYLSLYVNQGNGSFAPEHLITIANPYASTTDVAATDFDGDGRPDLLLNSSRGPVVLFNTGNASSGWLAPAAGPVSTTSTNDGFQVADLNQDGKADFICALAEPSATPVYTTQLNNGTNTAFTAGFQFASASQPVLVDLDKDGKVDILATTAAGPLLYRNLGAGNFGVGTSLGIPTAGTPAVADFDGDGWLDLFFTSGTQLVSYRNLGAGAFAAAATTVAAASFYGPVVGDINGDGRPDIAAGIALSTNPQVSTLLNTTPLAARTPQTQLLGLSPNPATDVVRLQLPAAALPAQVRLYTTMGQLARSSPSPDGTLSVRGLHPGLYIVQVQHQGQQWATRLQVQ